MHSVDAAVVRKRGSEIVRGLPGSGTGQSVNDSECDGLLFLNTDKAFARKELSLSGCGTCGVECGARTNWRTSGVFGGTSDDNDDTEATDARWLSESSLSFARTDLGEGGWADATEPGDGVGGYECTAVSVLAVSIDDFEDSDLDASGRPADAAAAAAGLSVRRFGGLTREEKDSAASAWKGDAVGNGASGIDTPGGKAGVRSLRYHPRFGR